MEYKLLYDLLQARATPEAVTAFLLGGLEGLTEEEKEVLRLSSFFHRNLSMVEDFHRPESQIQRQIDLIPVLFSVEPQERENLPLLLEIFKPHFSRRWTKEERRRMGIYKNARWFNKRRRLLNTIRRKLERLNRAEEMYLFTRISKSALSVDIPFELFAKDQNTAALVTYLAARMNRRSVFTNRSQDRAFDQICQMLLDRCENSPSTQWFVIAHLLPDKTVLDQLTDAEKGYLVGRWYSLLERMSERLEECWSEDIDRLQMVVQRGNDSSTWNAVAGAWNRAREHWISLVYQISGNEILKVVCPGKVMRLMAADVVWWHDSSGGDIHPDTKVWASLPFPWEVLKGKAECGLEDIQRECLKAGTDFRSWIQRESREVVSFKPTPDLVHGVEVGSPELATILRKAGVFSGGQIKGEIPSVDIHRDQYGAAILVTEEGDTESSWASSTRADGSANRQDEE